MNDADFTNWANGHTGSPLYTSGQVTVADVKVDFPEPGVYVVLFDNKFPGMTPKPVEVDPPPPPTAKAATEPQAKSDNQPSGGRAYLATIVISLLGAPSRRRDSERALQSAGRGDSWRFG